MQHGLPTPKANADADPRRWVALAILLLATFMNLLDLTIVNVALPSIERELHSSTSEIEWVLAGYSLAFALGLLPFGRLGDTLGRKQLFLVGVGIFVLASSGAGFAPTIELLIAARVLEGLGGGIMAPQVLALLQLMFSGREKGRAFALFGLVNGLAAVTGPVVGGVLVSADLFALGWRPIFLVNVPIGLLAIAAGIFLVPAIRREPSRTNDSVGIVLSGLAILALVFPLVEGQTLGWPLWLFALIAVSVVLLVLFYRWEQSREAVGAPQLLAPSLLRQPNFLLGAATTLVFFSAVPGLFLILALLLQGGFGLSPLQSGLATLPWPLGVVLASLVSAWAGNRLLRARLVAGSLLLTFGLTLLRLTMTGAANSVDVWAFVLPLAISGGGLGLMVSALFQLTLAAVPAAQAGIGSGTLQTFQQVGGALGIAALGQIFFPVLRGEAAAGAAALQSYVAAASDALVYNIVALMAATLMGLFFRAPSLVKDSRAGPGPVPAHPVTRSPPRSAG